ncbi:hypothetical protein [Croceiramulus getboli]|nr:hypothetical protein P8624_00215 [Flavobacteriaceae bacterium YJPT1-3]
MRAILSFLVLSLFLCSCSNDDDASDQQRIDYNLYTNAALNIPAEDADFFLVTIAETGDQLVFEYVLDIPSDPDIADSGFRESILFEIDASTTTFEVSDEDLLTINPYYRQSCFCETVESVLIQSGTISGTRSDQNSWQIDIDVEIDLGGTLPLEKQVSGVFRQN